MTSEIQGTLYDSDTNEYLDPSDLGLTDEQYDELVAESIDCSQAEGHVRAPNGRRVYAPAECVPSVAKSLESLSAADAMHRANALTRESDRDQNWEMGATTFQFSDGSQLQICGQFVKELHGDEMIEI